MLQMLVLETEEELFVPLTVLRTQQLPIQGDDIFNTTLQHTTKLQLQSNYLSSFKEGCLLTTMLSDLRIHHSMMTFRYQDDIASCAVILSCCGIKLSEMFCCNIFQAMFASSLDLYALHICGALFIRQRSRSLLDEVLVQKKLLQL